MATRLKNTKPRQSLTDWRLDKTSGWVLLALTGGVSASAWRPPDLMLARDLLQFVGCFAGGMIIAGKGAIWQQTGRPSNANHAPAPDAGTRPQELSGWRYHADAVRILLALVFVGVCGMVLVPREWAPVGMCMQLVSMVAAGMLAAKDAAIWVRTGQPHSGRKE